MDLIKWGKWSQVEFDPHGKGDVWVRADWSDAPAFANRPGEVTLVVDKKKAKQLGAALIRMSNAKE